MTTKTDYNRTITTRDRQFIQCVSEGMKNIEIAHELGVTHGSVKVRLHRIFNFLGLSNRVELALWWIKQSGVYDEAA